MKGQITIIAIVMAAVSILVIAALSPLFVAAGDMIETADPTATVDILLGKSMLLFLLLALIVSILGYAAYIRWFGPQAPY